MTTYVSSAAADGAVVAVVAPPARRTAARTTGRVPLTRLVRVELRKSVDTRSGRWLLASLGLAALLTTGAIIAWAPSSQLAYSEFTLAIGVPMTIILPIIAVLSVTSEWSQRSGLATFTLVPHRGRVVLAKAVAAVLVTLPATAVAFAVGALGNLIGTALADVPAVWNQSLVDVGYFAAGQTLLLLVGFVLGALIRNSSGAIVAYMLYGFVVPGLLAFLAFNQDWFADARPWLDAKYSQDALLRGELAGDGWSHLAFTSVVWLVVPMLVAVVNVLPLGSEVMHTNHPGKVPGTAVAQTRYSDPDVVRLGEHPRPVPGAGEVLVQLHAASVNARDWHVLCGEPRVARLMDRTPWTLASRSSPNGSARRSSAATSRPATWRRASAGDQFRRLPTWSSARR